MTPTLQNPGDRNRQVHFIKWDADRRPKEDIRDLEETTFDLGEFIRVDEQDMALIDWKVEKDGQTKYVRSLHYVTEFEEHHPTVYVPDTSDESESKVAYIKMRNLRLFKDASGKRYFKDSRDRNWTTTEVNRRYQSWQLSKAVMERLSIIAKLDGDYASTLNGVGFSKNDTEFGHNLVDWFNEKGFWTIPMLKGGIRLVHKYRKQIEHYCMAKSVQLTAITSYRGLTELEELGDKYLDESDTINTTAKAG